MPSPFAHAFRLALLLVALPGATALGSEDPRDVFHIVDLRCPKDGDGQGYQLSRNMRGARVAFSIAYRDGEPVRVIVRSGQRGKPMTTSLDLSLARAGLTAHDAETVKTAGAQFADIWQAYCDGGPDLTAAGRRRLAENRRLLGLSDGP